MALPIIEQVQKLIHEHSYFLLTFPAVDRGDALASSLALADYLIAKGKQVDIVSAGYTLPASFKFLHGSDRVRSELNNIHKFIVKVDVANAPVESLSYDIKDGWLSIYITPKSGSLSKHELRTAQTNFKYDAIFTFGAADLEQLGTLYANNTDLFFRTPIVNIDVAAHNERFGAINYVELTAAAVSEAMIPLLKGLGVELSAATATQLLTGMTSATKSFTSASVTPRTLAAASELVERGADREQVVQHLYRTRSVGTLKLWGSALTHLQFEPHADIVTTTISREDFTRTGTDSRSVTGLIEELIANTPEAHRFVLVYEDPKAAPGTFGVLVAVNRNYDALKLTAQFSPHGNSREASFSIVAESLAAALEKVKAALTNK